MPTILKLASQEQDEALELQHELDYQQSLTVAERFAIMFQKSQEIAGELLKRGYRKPFEIIKRA